MSQAHQGAGGFPIAPRRPVRALVPSDLAEPSLHLLASSSMPSPWGRLTGPAG